MNIRMNKDKFLGWVVVILSGLNTLMLGGALAIFVRIIIRTSDAFWSLKILYLALVITAILIYGIHFYGGMTDTAINELKEVYKKQNEE